MLAMTGTEVMIWNSGAGGLFNSLDEDFCTLELMKLLSSFDILGWSSGVSYTK